MDKTKFDKDSKHSPNSIHKTAPGFFSSIFFGWTIPVFRKGLRKNLTEEDLLPPLTSQESKRLGDALEKSWNKELTQYRSPSLIRALCRLFCLEFFSLTAIWLISELSKIVQTLSLGQLMLYYMSDQHGGSTKSAYLYASAIASISVLNTFLGHNYMMRVYFLGMKLKIAASAVVYRKSLRLSHRALQESTVGKIVNMLANDVNRFEAFVVHVQTLLFSPIIIAIVVYVLYSYVGLTACVGMLSYLLYFPIQMYTAKKVSVYRLQTALRTDERVRLMSEIISGIKVIKMYTWEKPFAILVAKIRKLEIKQIRGVSYIRGGMMSFGLFATRFAVYISVLAHVLLGNPLNAYYVYVATAFYGSLRVLMTVHFPQGMTEIAELRISLNRIQSLLMAEEITTDRKDEKAMVENGKANAVLHPTPLGVSIENATAKWNAESSDDTLSEVQIEVGSKDLVAVVGTVGSGKSSLLQAILKELPLVSGTIQVNGSISYAAQESWLFTGTVKQNILFGQPLDPERYQKVVKVCALERDFSLFPYGDNTLVGERGVMLSGGQKARINLARAVYKNADIYLLDDPLSAVDTHVGNQLFEECITNFLKEKCVILVTHQLQYLRNVDNLVILESGRVKAQGRYQDLYELGYFGELLGDQGEINDDEEEEEESDGLKVVSPEANDVKEQRSYGTIKARVYKAYIDAGGGILTFMWVYLLYIFAQVMGNAVDYFATFWVNMEQWRTENEKQNTTTNESDWRDFFTTNNLIYFYSAFVFLLITSTLIRSTVYFYFCMKASTNLHNNMFTKIVYGFMSFFNNNPSGRILNRFSKDMGAVDETLPIALSDASQIGLNVLGVVIMISIVNYWMLLPIVVVGGIAYLLRVIYMSSSRSVKRMEGITKSPVFTHLSATLEGIVTIRAFGVQGMLRSQFDCLQDLHTSAYYTFISCSRTFGFWVDCVLSIYIVVVTYSFLVIGDESYAGNVGLAITQAISLLGVVQWGLRQWSEFENQMTSVERIVEYTDLDAEKVEVGTTPTTSWPDQGHIEFRSVSMRYSEENPYVLKNLNFIIRPNEKVGIVGRTGAGKSSLIAALFLLNEIEGDILIDNITSKEIKLELLRSKISIIPQEPVLFSGSLRRNLDPFDEYQDFELWNALEEVELRHTVADLPSGLEHRMSEGGSNFSVGQRQLLCLARAVIRKNKILVMDEATANVDGKTDELIQKTIRRKFAECTVLTIAHRLHTVMDSDKVLVMDEGKAVEYDHPYLLLQNKRGVFYGLLQQMGAGMSENLTNIAKQSYERKQLSTNYSAGS